MFCILEVWLNNVLRWPLHPKELFSWSMVDQWTWKTRAPPFYSLLVNCADTLFTDYTDCRSFIFLFTDNLDMQNANVRQHLTEAELWCAVMMVEYEAAHRQVGVTFSVDHTVISRGLAIYQQHGTTVRRHGRGRQIATTAAEDLLFIIQARQGRFSTATHLRYDHRNALGSMYRCRPSVESCTKIISDRIERVYIFHWLAIIGRPALNAQESTFGRPSKTGCMFCSPTGLA